MSRRATEFQTIRSEGGLLPPDLLRRVVDPAGKVPGVEATAYGLPEGERFNEAITQSWTRLRRHWSEFRAVTKSLPEGDAATGLTNDKWSLPLLRELGFGFLTTTAGPVIDGKTYAISRFAGPTAIAFINGEAVDAAKAIKKFAKDNKALIIKGGYMDGRSLTVAEVEKIADLESREVLLAKLAGAMKGNQAKAVGLFNAPLSQFARLAAALQEKKAGETAA